MYLPEDVWRYEASHYLGEEDLEGVVKSAARDGDKIAADSQIEGLDEALFTKLNVLEGDLAPLSEPDSHAMAIEVSLDEYGKVAHPEHYPAIGEEIKVTYGNGDWTAYRKIDVSVNPPRGLREPRNHARILQSPNRLQWTATESVREIGGIRTWIRDCKS